MLLSVPDIASSETIPVDGVPVEYIAPRNTRECTVIYRENLLLTGFRKEALDEAEYFVDATELLGGAHIVSVMAWADRVPSLVTKVEFDPSRIVVFVWGGRTSGRHEISVVFATSDTRVRTVKFAVITVGDFSFYGASVSEFPDLEDEVHRIMNISLPGYDFTPWGV